jgi:hypothetical protein
MSAETNLHAPYWTLPPRFLATALSYRRYALWYVSGVIGAVRRHDLRVPEGLARGSLAATFVMVGLWLIPHKGSAPEVMALGSLVLLFGGLIAGWRIGWIAVPAAVWFMLAVYNATDCPDCGGGGEEVGPPFAWIVTLTIVFALAALTGGLGGLLFSRGRLPVSKGTLVVGSVLLLAAFGALVLIRQRANADANGSVVFERDGIRYRTGAKLDDPSRTVAGAAASLQSEAAVWLGDRVGEFSLTAVQSAPDLLLAYGKCGPAPCTAPVQVITRRFCGTPPEVEFATLPVETRSDGVVIVTSPAGGGPPSAMTKAAMWTGRLQVTVYAHEEAGNATELLGELRRLDAKPLAPADSSC